MSRDLTHLLNRSKMDTKSRGWLDKRRTKGGKSRRTRGREGREGRRRRRRRKKMGYISIVTEVFVRKMVQSFMSGFLGKRGREKEVGVEGFKFIGFAKSHPCFDGNRNVVGT